MAFNTKGNKVIMDAYDYGIQLPFDITGTVFSPTDKMRFELKKSEDSETLFTKDYLNELDTTSKFRFFLELTQKESENLPSGNYVYYVRYIKGGSVKDTVVSGEVFKIKKGNG